MRVYLKDNIISIHRDDLPNYKKNGSVVRNNYFWALKSIACYTGRESEWEFDSEVWIALCRMLTFFTESGYLGSSETLLEFSLDSEIPEVLRPVSTWN